MPDTKDKKLRKLLCEQMYVELDIGIDECATLTGASKKSVYRWIREGRWNEKKVETFNLEKLININLKRALNQGLKNFAIDPANKDLQSLVSLLKQFKEQNKPTHAYKDNILNFLDKTTDFFLEKNMEEIANVFKGYVVELAEYLMVRR